MPNERLESNIESKCVKWADKYKIESIKLNLQGNIGWPDRLFLFPYRPIFIEFKRKGEQPRPMQWYRLRYLIRNGYDAFYCDTAAKGIAILEAARLHEDWRQAHGFTSMCGPLNRPRNGEDQHFIDELQNLI